MAGPVTTVGRAAASTLFGTLAGVLGTRPLHPEGWAFAAELVVDLQADALVAPSEQTQKDLWELLNTRCLSIAGGTTQVLRNVAGERILGLPR